MPDQAHIRYRTLHQYCRDRYGERVQRIPVDAGFNCPNRDGTRARGGCTFCNNDTFNFSPKIPLADQIRRGLQRAAKRYRARKFMLYFQPYTNTYAPVPVLRRIYDHIRMDPRFVALAVGTRADCLSEAVVDLLLHYARDYEVWVELGLQTVHQATLDRINRAESVATYRAWVERLAGTPLRVCLHLLMGLPGEDFAMMLETLRQVATWPMDGVKIHNLHIVRGTALGTAYRRSPWPLLTLDEYAELLAHAVAWLPPGVVFHRLVAQSPPDMLLAPDWAPRRAEVLARFHQILEERDWFQGCRHAEVHGACRVSVAPAH